MTCQQRENVARKVIGWVLLSLIIILINAFFIGLSMTDGGAWWTIHVGLVIVTGLIAAITLIVSWLEGNVSLCRKR